uniref:Uncharacterized protein n=1 Tax=Glossina palpalis gambiensis TaxID=67801 RepID=A0A1B0AWN3_9MUSC
MPNAKGTKWKANSFGGASQAKGRCIALEKVDDEAKQPNSTNLVHCCALTFYGSKQRKLTLFLFAKLLNVTNICMKGFKKWENIESFTPYFQNSQSCFTNLVTQYLPKKPNQSREKIGNKSRKPFILLSNISQPKAKVHTTIIRPIPACFVATLGKGHNNNF